MYICQLFNILLSLFAIVLDVTRFHLLREIQARNERDGTHQKKDDPLRHLSSQTPFTIMTCPCL